jgi:hypothetical protein
MAAFSCTKGLKIRPVCDECSISTQFHPFFKEMCPKCLQVVGNRYRIV